MLLGGRYRLGSCLCGGGMADVHRAMDAALQRVVAVKQFRGFFDFWDVGQSQGQFPLRCRDTVGVRLDRRAGHSSGQEG